MISLNLVRNLLLVFVVATAIVSCKSSKSKGGKSNTTGWAYNDPKTPGSFYVAKPKDVKTGPGLVFVQGGTFTMGCSQEDIMGDWNNIQRRVTINSFFIDKCEVANVDYREYLYWLGNVFGDTSQNYYKDLVEKAKPDTLVWRSELAYNEPYVEYYFSHPSFNYYPVVGVNWRQASDYSLWRTDRVNEKCLIDAGYLDKADLKREMNNGGMENFVTKSYLMGEYKAKPGKLAKSKQNPLLGANGKPRTQVKFEDGILFADYRLPTEAEWEYAASALISENPQPKGSSKSRGEEMIANKQIYGWKNDGFDNIRSTRPGAFQGAFLANFKRGNGDNMGVAGGLNDNAAITSPVVSFIPNSFGIYNMCGNVTEWVQDVFRPTTTLEADDFNPFRGNTFMKLDRSKGVGNMRDSAGRLLMVPETAKDIENGKRRYKNAKAIDFRDGDSISSVVYAYGISTLISDKSRVLKGASWNDRAYWLSPGTRRFLQEDQSSSTIGFRCAMTHYGASEGTQVKNKTGNIFPPRKPRR